MGTLIPTDLIRKLNNNVISKRNLFIFAGLEGNCDVFQELAECLAKSSIQVYGLQFTNKVLIVFLILVFISCKFSFY
jgi:hypothetical protein